MNGCLMIIDMQKGIFELSKAVYQKERLVGNTKAALQFARDRGIAVVFSRHENDTFLRRGTQGYRVIDELDIREGDVVIEKKHPDIFVGTALDDRLRENHISRVMIAGLISNGCVRDACLSALKRGYQVTLIGDAHSTFYTQGQRIVEGINSEMERAGVRVVSADELKELSLI